VLFIKWCYGDQTEDVWIGSTCNTHSKINAYQQFVVHDKRDQP